MMTHRPQRGFTLIELITTIVLIGIIATVLAPIINMSIQGFADSETRTELTAKGRLALERIARELRHAIPNSIIILNDGTASEGIEFISSRSGGRYIDATDDFGSTFTQMSRRFQKGVVKNALYALAPGLSLQTHDQLVIGSTSNTGLLAGSTIVAIIGISNTTVIGDGTADGKVITFASHVFPNDSPGRHFQIADVTHEIGQLGNDLRWHRTDGVSGYNQIADWDATDPLLIDNVTSIDFTYIPGSPQSNGILRVEMRLDKGKESIALYDEIQIRNTP